MERLTTRSILGGWTLKVPRQEAVDRLAAYEDICFDVDGKERITVDELSALVKARDVIVETAADREYIDYICPKCGDIISQRRKGQKDGAYMPKHHDSCGQRLDWARAEAEAAIGGGGDG